MIIAQDRDGFKTAEDYKKKKPGTMAGLFASY
jgi:hypothetical protein